MNDYASQLQGDIASLRTLLRAAKTEHGVTLERAEAAEKKLADCEGVMFEEGVTEAKRRAEKAETEAKTLKALINQLKRHLGASAWLDLFSASCLTALTPIPTEERTTP